MIPATTHEIIYDPTIPDRVIEFCETLKLSSGSYIGQPVHLRGWQKKPLGQVFGRVYRDTGLRAVRTFLLTMARKNAKTELIAMVALACMCVEGLAQRNGQIVICATDQEQAGILFRAMATMIYQDQELMAAFNVIEHKKRINYLPLAVRCHVVPAVVASLHGLNPYIVIEDETGNWPARRGEDIHHVLNTCFGAQQEPLTILLSTQAPTDQHFFSELVDYGKKIIEGEVEDPSFYPVIYEVPMTEEDIWDEKVWYQANPALNDFRSLDEMRLMAKKAAKIPSLENAFRNLFLNQRVQAYAPFLSPQIWKACSDPVDVERLYGRACYAGLDLASKRDLCSLVLVFPPEDDDKDQRIDVLAFFWLPGHGIKEKSDYDKVPYDLWAQQGYLDIDSKVTVHYGLIAHKLESLAEDFDLQVMGYDRWKFDDMLQELDNIGLDLPMEPVGQGYKDMSPCVEALETAAADERLRHGSNPVLNWCISNTVVEQDPAGNRKFNKSKSYGRIDGTVALAMALRMMEQNKGEEESVYETQDVLVL